MFHNSLYFMSYVAIMELHTSAFVQVSWQKQHSAPTAGIGFSPSNDKVSYLFMIDP